MTRSVEIPEEAVEAAALAMFADEHCDKRQMLDVRGNWDARLNDEDQALYRSMARASLTAALPYLAPAGDGGLREALEKKLATTDGWAVANETLLDMLAAHPAAPAVPQPVEGREAAITALMRAFEEAGERDRRALDGLGWVGIPPVPGDVLRQHCMHVVDIVMESLSAVPQPVDREALERVIEETFDEMERDFGDEGPPMETLIGQLAGNVLAVLAGEQEQVEPPGAEDYVAKQ